MALLEDHILEYPDSTHSRQLLEILIPHEFESVEEEEWFYITNILATTIVIGCVALVAGLFLGMMTLDSFNLKIIERSSLDDNERLYAATLYPIVEDRHLLLVTLLILNALAYETLPLFLEKMVPSWLAIVLSTTLVLLFGEIVPSAIFIGPQQLQLGYYMVPLVKVLLFLLYPVAKPCAKLLDYLVHGPAGDDEVHEEYNREELSALVKIQYEERTKEKKGFEWPSHLDSVKRRHMRTSSQWVAMKQEMLEVVSERLGDEVIGDEEDAPPLASELTAPLEKQEIDVVVGALQMKTKVATDVYTPRRQVYAIPDDLVLDRAGMTDIYAKGYSRVPVYKHMPDRDDEINRSCLMGFLMTRQLMLIDWDHEREVSTLPLVRPDCVSPRSNLVDLLKLLRSGGCLMAFVCARPDLANRALQAGSPIPVEAGFMGIVTLEDILESILQTRIYDETDIRERDRAVATLTKWAAEKLQSFARKSVAKRRFSGQFSEKSTSEVLDSVSNQNVSETTPLLNGK